MRSTIAGLVGAFLFVALRASAEQSFPGAIKEAGSIPCTPTCLLCHTEIPGSIGNLKQPFGLTVLGNGIVPGHPESMHTVVANLRSKMVDTDGDGKLDVDELAAGSDPNKKDPNAEICGPTYGCGAHVAAAPPSARTTQLWWCGVPVVLCMLVSMRRQWARRARSR